MDFHELPWLNDKRYSPEEQQCQRFDYHQEFDHHQENFNRQTLYQPPWFVSDPEEQLTHVTQGFHENIWDYATRVKHIVEIQDRRIDEVSYSRYLGTYVNQEKNHLKALKWFIEGLREELVNSVWCKRPMTIDEAVYYAYEAEEFLHARRYRTEPYHYSTTSSLLTCNCTPRRYSHGSPENGCEYDNQYNVSNYSEGKRNIEQISQTVNNVLTNMSNHVPQFESDPEAGEGTLSNFTPATEAHFWIENEIVKSALRYSPCRSSMTLQTGVRTQSPSTKKKQTFADTSLRLDEPTRKRTRRSTRKKTGKSTPRQGKLDTAVRPCDNFKTKHQQLPSDRSKSLMTYEGHVGTIRNSEVAVPPESVVAAQCHPSSAETLATSHHSDNIPETTPGASDLMDIMMKMFDRLIDIESHSSVPEPGSPIAHSSNEVYPERYDSIGEVSVHTHLAAAESSDCGANVKKIALKNNDMDKLATLLLEDVDSSVAAHNEKLAVPVHHLHGKTREELSDSTLDKYCGLKKNEGATACHINCQNLEPKPEPNEIRKGVG